MLKGSGSRGVGFGGLLAAWGLKGVSVAVKGLKGAAWRLFGSQTQAPAAHGVGARRSLILILCCVCRHLRNPAEMARNPHSDRESSFRKLASRKATSAAARQSEFLPDLQVASYPFREHIVVSQPPGSNYNGLETWKPGDKSNKGPCMSLVCGGSCKGIL